MKPLAQIGRAAVRAARDPLAAARALGWPDRGERRLIYLFSGNAPVWRAPGAVLWRESAAFRAGVEEVAPIVEALLGLPAGPLVAGEWRAERREEEMRAEIVAMLLVQIGLVDAWRSAGVAAGAAAGISGGEVAAAYAAGALARADAVTVLAAIAKHLEHQSAQVRVFDVACAPGKALRLVRSAPRPLRFAGEIMPGVCVLDADAADADALRPWLAARAPIRDERRRAHRYHVDGIGFDEDGFRADLAAIAPRPPRIPLYLSACAGRLPDGLRLDADYWHWMTISPYRFAEAAAAAAADGFDRAAVFAASTLGGWYLHAAGRRRGARLVLPFHRTPQRERPWEAALSELAAMRVAAPARPAPTLVAEVEPATLDLTAPGIVEDPFPAYEALRRLSPVHQLPRHNFWIVLGHEAMREACAQPTIFSNRPYAFVDPVLIGADPPRHAAIRRLVAPFFSADALARGAALAERTARALVRPRFDLVGGYAAPLARVVAADLIGFDEAAVEAIQDGVEEAQAAPDPFAAVAAALDRLAPRAQAWERIRADGEGLVDEAEARSLVRFLWLAAITTTERVIVRAGMRLIADPMLRDRLAAEPALVKPFVEEVMRLHPPEHMLPRLTTAAATLAGVELPAGAAVMLCTSAANRDPAAFDDPAALRLDRGLGRHLSFGSGPHVCSGAALARRVIPAAVEALVAPPARLRALQPPATVRWLKTEMTLAPLGLVVAT